MFNNQCTESSCSLDGDHRQESRCVPQLEVLDLVSLALPERIFSCNKEVHPSNHEKTNNLICVLDSLLCSANQVESVFGEAGNEVPYAVCPQLVEAETVCEAVFHCLS